MGTLARSTPERQGIDSAAIAAFLDEANATIQGLHGLLLLRHGQVVAEGWWSPYEPADPHVMFSLSKSFTSTAVGILVGEGRIKVTDPVISFFPADLPPIVSPNLSAMQVHHLLTMTTGHATDTVAVIYDSSITNWSRAILAYPVEYEPGTFFQYNTGATFLLSAIIQKVTGQTMLEYLEPRLFQPLGIENPAWETNPQGISTGGFGLGITTEAVARFGQLYLQKGSWEGQRILSEEWVEAATSAQVSNGINPESDWEQGYGYQFWRCRHGAFRADGAFGQFSLVMPEQDAVLAITSGIPQMEMITVLNLVWKHQLPAMAENPLPENPAANEELSRKLQQLEIPPLKDSVSDTVTTSISGKSFSFVPNNLQISKISFDFDSSGATLNIEDAFSKSEVVCGNGTWRKGISTFNQGLPRKVAASGGWSDPQTYLISLYFLTPVLSKTPPAMTISRMPFSLTIKCRFDDAKVLLDLQPNVALIEDLPAQLTGTLA